MCKILWRITQLHTKTPFWILVFLAGWLVDWQFVVPKKDLHPSLQLQKKKQQKRESALCNISNSSWNTPGGAAAAQAAAKVGGSYRRTTGYEKLK